MALIVVFLPSLICCGHLSWPEARVYAVHTGIDAAPSSRVPGKEKKLHPFPSTPRGYSKLSGDQAVLSLWSAMDLESGWRAPHPVHEL